MGIMGGSSPGLGFDVRALMDSAGSMNSKDIRCPRGTTRRPLSSSFYGLFKESYKVISKRNYLGAYGYAPCTFHYSLDS